MLLFASFSCYLRRRSEIVGSGNGSDNVSDCGSGVFTLFVLFIDVVVAIAIAIAGGAAAVAATAATATAATDLISTQRLRIAFVGPKIAFSSFLIGVRSGSSSNVFRVSE